MVEIINSRTLQNYVDSFASGNPVEFIGSDLTVGPGVVGPVFETRSSAAAANLSEIPSVTVSRFSFTSLTAPAIYVPVLQPANVEPTHIAKFISLDGVWFELSRNQAIYLEMFGITKGGSPSDIAAATANAYTFQNAIDYLDADPTGVCGILQAYPGRIYLHPDASLVSITNVKAHRFSFAGQGALPNVVVYEPELAQDCTVFCFVGDGTKVVRTRWRYRASAADPQDPPLAVGFDNQAIGAIFENCRFEVYADYSDMSVPNISTGANMGANWDFAFMTSRMYTKLHDVSFWGYPRWGHILFDATRGIGLPEFDPSFPTDTNAKGIDGCQMIGVHTMGAPGWRLFGPEPKEGLLHPGFQYDRACKIAASSNPVDGSTVTIGTEVFTFRTVKRFRYEVLIGSTAAETISNLRTEWLVEKIAPYETLTLSTNNTLLNIYSTSTTPTPVSTTSVGLAVQLVGSSTAATQTEAISDPAPYYDEILGAAVDDGRDSLGASDFYVAPSCSFSVAHHSKRRVFDIRPDKNHLLEDKQVWCAWHIDGMGGSILIHKGDISPVRSESVEPFQGRFVLGGRTVIGPQARFDSNVTGWRSNATNTALTSADQYSKIAGDPVKTCYVNVLCHDDPGANFPNRQNGNRQVTNFQLVANDIHAERNIDAGGYLKVGLTNFGTTQGYVEVFGGEAGQAEVRFSSPLGATHAAFRCNPVTGNLSIRTKVGGTGAIADRLFITDTAVQAVNIPTRGEHLIITDGVTAPGNNSGQAKIYVDSADGDLKIKFADNVVKTIVTDT